MALDLEQRLDAALKRADKKSKTLTPPASSQSEWWTPPSMWQPGGLLHGTAFALDPCSPGKDKVPWIPADRHITKEQNGLVQEWTGSVWLNPPYDTVARWIDRFLSHPFPRGAVLTYARTDTKWGQNLLKAATFTVFLAGRVRFHPGAGQPTSAGPAGSMLTVFGVEENKMAIARNMREHPSLGVLVAS